MPYRIEVFQGDNKLLDLACNRPLDVAREEAVEMMAMLKADHAVILDTDGELVERVKCTA